MSTYSTHSKANRLIAVNSVVEFIHSETVSVHKKRSRQTENEQRGNYGS